MFIARLDSCNAKSVRQETASTNELAHSVEEPGVLFGHLLKSLFEVGYVGPQRVDLAHVGVDDLVGEHALLAPGRSRPPRDFQQVREDGAKAHSSPPSSSSSVPWATAASYSFFLWAAM
jgi:hypothetical protein